VSVTYADKILWGSHLEQSVVLEGPMSHLNILMSL
jgi:hypothetical protein